MYIVDAGEMDREATEQNSDIAGLSVERGKAKQPYTSLPLRVEFR